MFEYIKTFDVPEEYRCKRVTFQFEGVYRDAMVFINGEFAAHRPYGYFNCYVQKEKKYQRHKWPKK
jgi:beta-galactosidase